MDYTLKPIGYVRSTVKERKQMPAFGAAAEVELLPEFAPGLLKIDKHSHLWVMAWLMARPERDVLQVVPRGVDPQSEDPLHGVFSVRSPARPNPVGLTAAEFLGRQGLVLRFDRLDFLDGTPVIDLKPYFPSRDLIFSAASRAVGRVRTREALRESMLFQALRHQPVRHPDVALAIRVMEHYRVEVLNWREPAGWQVVAPADRPYLADAIVGLTRSTFADGLAVGGGGHVSLNPDGRYEIFHTEMDFDGILGAEESALFTPSE